MVTTEYVKLIGVSDLECEQQTDRFDGLLSAVDIVTKKQVVRERREATILKQSQQVVVLSVDIT